MFSQTVASVNSEKSVLHRHHSFSSTGDHFSIFYLVLHGHPVISRHLTMHCGVSTEDMLCFIDGFFLGYSISLVFEMKSSLLILCSGFDLLYITFLAICLYFYMFLLFWLWLNFSKIFICLFVDVVPF